MPSRRAFLMASFTALAVYWGPLTLLKIWAARHSTHNGIDGTVAQVINVGG